MTDALSRLIDPIGVALLLSVVALGVSLFLVLRRRRRFRPRRRGRGAPDIRILPTPAGTLSPLTDDLDPHTTLVIERRVLGLAQPAGGTVRSRTTAQDLRGPDANFGESVGGSGTRTSANRQTSTGKKGAKSPQDAPSTDGGSTGGSVELPPPRRRTAPARDGSGELRRPADPQPARGNPDLLRKIGVNVVLNEPSVPEVFSPLPGRIEIIYGNLSPNDPREIQLYWPTGALEAPYYVFSRSPGEGVRHIQLNHYTVAPDVQAYLLYDAGRYTLSNGVSEDELDRYQVRVNGVAMVRGERISLDMGDIISMGIFRLKLVI